MDSFSALDAKPMWSPLSYYGITSSFASISQETIIATWVVLGIAIITVIILRYVALKQSGPLFWISHSFIKGFIDLSTQTLGVFHYRHFSFIISLFLFIFYCNILGLIPFLEEPTADLNTPLALGIVAFLYTNFYAIKAHGVGGYLKEFFQPFFLMFPLHIVGKLAGIISISFRLFGNIFGGAIISNIYFNALGHSYILAPLGIISGLNIGVSLFFGVFESFIQAFIFAMLTLTHLSIQTQEET